MFRGTFTALVTPFRDGAIDVAAFEKLIEGHQVEFDSWAKQYKADHPVEETNR